MKDLQHPPYSLPNAANQTTKRLFGVQLLINPTSSILHLPTNCGISSVSMLGGRNEQEGGQSACLNLEVVGEFAPC